MVSIKSGYGSQRDEGDRNNLYTFPRSYLSEGDNDDYDDQIVKITSTLTSQEKDFISETVVRHLKSKTNEVLIAILNQNNHSSFVSVIILDLIEKHEELRNKFIQDSEFNLN